MTKRIGQQLGNYRLVSLLGKGGFADTYLGQHIYLQTFAAIKVLQTQLGKLELDAFYNEARFIAKLKHPNIVRLLEFGLDHQVPYLVMEYAPNGTLRQRHPRGSTLSLNVILPYVKQIASAVQYAHDQKLIHRDVKPENMLLGPGNEVLLSDFGIAVIVQTWAHNQKNIAGTVTYMAPEQIQGRPCPASDQYALGILVYEWLCGVAPFGGIYTEIALQHECTPPPPLRIQRETILPEIEEIVLTALAKDPQQRFSSIQGFANALEQACKDLPLDEPCTSQAEVHCSDPQLNIPTEAVLFSHMEASLSAKQVFLASAKVQGSVLLQSAPPVPLEKFSLPDPSEEISLSIPPVPSIQRHYYVQGSLSSKQFDAYSLSQTRASTQHISSQAPQKPLVLVFMPQNVGYADSPSRSMKVHTLYTSSPPPLKQPTRLQYSRVPAVVLLLLFILFLLGGSQFIHYAAAYQSSLEEAATRSMTQASRAPHAQKHDTIPALIPLQNIYTQAISGTPTINDHLSSQDDFNWDSHQRVLSGNQRIGTCTFKNNAYDSSASPGQFINCMALETNFRNMAYQVDMTILYGHAGGLVFRGDSNSSGYYFRISTDGTYIFQKKTRLSDGTIRQLTLASGMSSAINTGKNQSNKLAIVAHGKTIYLYVNARYLDSASDDTYTSGQIGVYADSDIYGTEVVFSNAQVWKSPD